MNKIDDLGQLTIKKITNRLVPFLLLLYIISYIDRVNIGYAALDMNTALGISSASFGLLSGIFFIGYFLFEIPSNILLHRIGANKWIARILISWGAVTVATMWVQNVEHLYVLRFLLGAAEAGFFPGIILYLTYWIPEKDRAKTVALFMTAMPVANIIGSPLSTWIMDNITWMGIPGWRWMFCLEGIPAVILGIITLFFLTNKPENAKWLSVSEKAWLTSELAKENQAKPPTKNYSILKVFSIPKLWKLSLIYVFIVMGGISIAIWLPTIVKEFAQYTNSKVGLIIMIPYTIGGVIMVLWSRHSDKTGERKYHAAIPQIMGAIGILITALSADITVKMFGITLVVVGMYCSYGPFWTFPAAFLAGESAAVGLATINSIGNLAGFIGPYFIGYLRGITGNMNAVLAFLCVCFVICFLLLMSLPKTETKIESDVDKHEAKSI